MFFLCLFACLLGRPLDRGEMAGLQRSLATFRRSGSSGLVWDDAFLSSGDSDQKNKYEEHKGEESKDEVCRELPAITKHWICP